MSKQPIAAIVGALLLWAPGAPADETQEALELARKTLAFVEQGAPRPKLAAELKALEKRVASAKTLKELEGVSKDPLYAEVRRLRRRIILSHPLLDFDKLLINKRTCRIPGHMCDQYLGRHHSPGPGLAVLESWRDRPKETLLLEGKLPKGLVMHPDLSFDARRVLFAFCDLSGRKDRRRRGHFIYEIELGTGQVRQLTGTARDRFEGRKGRQTVLIEDFDPCYLPDGGFAFISTRSQQYGRCHGDRYVPSYVLYRADADGSNIRQLSFNEANEWDPSVLHDGSIVYCRWDYINRHDTNYQSLWVIRPDGRGTAHFYGNNSVGPCMIAEARAIPESHKVVATATDHHGYTAGSIIVIDTYKGQDGGAPLLAVTPEIGFPERRPPRGTTFAPRPLSKRPDGSPYRSGRAATPWPISEDLFLVALDHGGRYAIYLVDTLGGRELIHEDPKISCFSPIPLRPVRKPPAVAPIPAGTEGEKTGLLYVQDVTRSRQPIERGTIKRLRVSEIISQPTRSKPALSYVNNEVIKRILGTVPVNADGSAAFEVPARTPLQFQILDGNGMAVMTMRSLVYLQPGEMASCVGCHEPREDTPAQPARRPPHVTYHKLTPPAGPRYDGGFSYVRTVQPVLDRYCIKCHGLGEKKNPINLLGTPSTYVTSYDSIMKRRSMVRIAQRNSESVPSRPKDYFAHASRLAKMLLDGHKDNQGKPKVRLDRESFQRIVDWLDLNAQFYGDYSFNRPERQPPLREGVEALRERIEERFGRELANQPLAALVNVALPAASRILKAPLAEKAGGWGQIERNGFSSTKDPGYREMLKLVRGSITPIARHDVAGTCGAEEGKGRCRCGNCWVRKIRAERQKRTAPAGRVAAGK